MYTDTHMHLADPQFDADRAQVLAWARDVQVSTMIEIAESPDMWDKAVALAEQHPFVSASLGIHPHHAHEAGPDRWPELETKLRGLLKHPKVTALGECGLDYFRMENTKDQQMALFRKQLELARELQKPIVIHCRDAHEDLQKTLFEFYPGVTPAMELTRPNGVIHCFSGTWEDAQAYLAHGFMLGIDGPVTYPSAKLLKENVRRLPLERLVLETDSPYLPPQVIRGQRNDPSQIPAIAGAVAALKRRRPEEIGQRTTANARALFRLA